MTGRRALLRQGAALLGLVALVALSITSLFVLGVERALQPLAAERLRNGQVLREAKLALIGYVAQQAALGGESNPGRLPCPEAAGYFGTASEGIAAASCRLPAVGRLPWRTLGLDKLRDATGEALWYAVSPGWALPNVTASLTINSNSKAQLSVDGRPNAAVALIIAPGRPLQVPASAGCLPRDQRRRSRDVAGNPLPPDARDFLECQNAEVPADERFATSGPSDRFNDQMVIVEAADLLPGIEAAIATRIEREIAPALRSAYASAEWSASPSNPVYPYAARFAAGAFNPDAWRGSAGTFQGLLPLTRAQGCNPGTESRCDAGFVAWAGSPTASFSVQGGSTMTVYSGPSYAPASGCTSTPASVQCTLYTSPAGTLALAVGATATSVSMSLRRLDKAVPAAGFAPDSAATPRNAMAILNSAGAAAVSFTGTVNAAGTPATCTRIHPPASFACQQRKVSVPIELLADHPLLDPQHAATGWFLRNDWHSLVYYAVAPGHAASSAPPRSCGMAPRDCLSVANLARAGQTRALLILTGRSLTGASRPSADLGEYLDSGENRDADLAFEQRRIDAAFNDRVIVVDANP